MHTSVPILQTRKLRLVKVTSWLHGLWHAYCLCNLLASDCKLSFYCISAVTRILTFSLITDPEKSRQVPTCLFLNGHVPEDCFIPFVLSRSSLPAEQRPVAISGWPQIPKIKCKSLCACGYDYSFLQSLKDLLLLKNCYTVLLFLH